MQSSNPNLIENLRQSFGVQRQEDGGANPPSDSDKGTEDKSKEDK